MKKMFLLVFTVIAVMLTINGCSKKGDVGPQGPAGINGTNGNDGTNGTNGTNGNANVQNYTLTISPSQWIYTSTYERWYYDYSCSANINSLVCGYVMSGSGEQAMPYYTCPSWECIQYDLATYLFGSPPYIEFQFTNYTSKTTAPSSDEYFYLVIVPPSQRLKNPNLNWRNYEEVKKAFNLGEPIKIKAGDIIGKCIEKTSTQH